MVCGGGGYPPVEKKKAGRVGGTPLPPKGRKAPVFIRSSPEKNVHSRIQWQDRIPAYVFIVRKTPLSKHFSRESITQFIGCILFIATV